MKLIPLPAFTDNHIWRLHDEREALVVNPGDAPSALDVLQQLGVQLGAILVTHHHADHSCGVNVLRQTITSQAIQTLDASASNEVSIFATPRQWKKQFQ
jgi:glyoxylase-like metal-dependent hydrolase (beta-lactamase superfamily II)